MRSIDSQDATAVEPASHNNEPQQDNARGGVGAASALERMKADHALRHKRQHGVRGVHMAGPGHEDDRSPER
jgi:hypothetical protein